LPCLLAFKDAFLTQLKSINVRSTEFPNTLAKMLASQEGMDIAMSLQGADALTLVDVLDQVSRPAKIGTSHFITPAQAFEASGLLPVGLQRKSIHILRTVCGLQIILPHSCILSDDTSKEGDIAFASGRFADSWKGRHNGKPVRLKAFRVYMAENPSKLKQVRKRSQLNSMCYSTDSP
jgi:hypothetical protein